MAVALLSIGSELLRGEVVNTNASWLAEQLTEFGHEVASIEVVADECSLLAETIGRLMATHRLIIATGGLGPTSDDLTAAAAALQAGVELVLDKRALGDIKRRVAERNMPLRASHEKQALLPEGSVMIPNSTGTAPGFSLHDGRCTAFYLPGVPSEMRTMFEQSVAPRVRDEGSDNNYSICLHTVGAGESWITEKLDGLELGDDVILGFRAKPSEVDIRIAARGSDPAEARGRAKRIAEQIRERLGDAVYGEGDQSIPHLAGHCLRKKGWRLAVAESCTGGLIAHQLTSMPASDYLVGSTVTYANAAKTRLLGVREDTLQSRGAVSAEVAAEMADGARQAFDCEVAISVTGIAGPTGGTPEKPVGLCYWALAHPGGTVVEDAVFSGDRNQVQHKAALAVLNLLRRTLS